MTQNQNYFRPPAEANSVIIQVTRGCPWNHCAFCGMYKCVSYAPRSLSEISRLICIAAQEQPQARRVFLADADVMHLPFPMLKKILQILNHMFPHLARVSIYANGNSINDKAPAELLQLRDLKLHTLYMGLESGDDTILERMNKRERVADMITACNSAQAAGLRMSVMFIVGLGGRDGSAAHASATAAALNVMQPRILSALRYVPVPYTSLLSAIVEERFSLLSEYEEVMELRDIIRECDLKQTVFRANHSSNAVPLEARLPADKDKLLFELNLLLLSNSLDRENPGQFPLAM